MQRILITMIGFASACCVASSFCFAAATLASSGSPYADTVGYSGLIIGGVIILSAFIIGALYE